MHELIKEIVDLLSRGLRCVCCTVAATRGSTPQKAGAIMLVFPDGTQSGTLGGGCVEAEVRRRALANVHDQSTIHTFHLDDDYGWDDGLICGGRMTIVTHPLDTEHLSYYQTLDSMLSAGRGFAEFVALNENAAGWPVGARALVTDNAMTSIMGADNADRFQMPTTKATKPNIVDGFAVLPVRSRIQLLIVGAGHVGQAVARLAGDTDFEIWVVDDREKFANAERFPNAARLIVGDIGRTLVELKPSIEARTYALIVTRGHSHDEEALYHLVTTPAGYLGMIGSKRKIRLIFDDLIAKGIAEESLGRVHAPVGLPIGSQTVPEIAVSIVAELIACRNNA